MGPGTPSAERPTPPPAKEAQSPKPEGGNSPTVDKRASKVGTFLRKFSPQNALRALADRKQKFMMPDMSGPLTNEAPAVTTSSVNASTESTGTRKPIVLEAVTPTAVDTAEAVLKGGPTTTTEEASKWADMRAKYAAGEFTPPSPPSSESSNDQAASTSTEQQGKVTPDTKQNRGNSLLTKFVRKMDAFNAKRDAKRQAILANQKSYKASMDAAKDIAKKQQTERTPPQPLAENTPVPAGPRTTEQQQTAFADRSRLDAQNFNNAQRILEGKKPIIYPEAPVAATTPPTEAAPVTPPQPDASPAATNSAETPKTPTAAAPEQVAPPAEAFSIDTAQEAYKKRIGEVNAEIDRKIASGELTKVAGEMQRMDAMRNAASDMVYAAEQGKSLPSVESVMQNDSYLTEAYQYAQSSIAFGETATLPEPQRSEKSASILQEGYKRDVANLNSRIDKLISENPSLQEHFNYERDSRVREMAKNTVSLTPPDQLDALAATSPYVAEAVKNRRTTETAQPATATSTETTATQASTGSETQPAAPEQRSQPIELSQVAQTLQQVQEVLSTLPEGATQADVEAAAANETDEEKKQKLNLLVVLLKALAAIAAAAGVVALTPAAAGAAAGVVGVGAISKASG